MLRTSESLPHKEFHTFQHLLCMTLLDADCSWPVIQDMVHLVLVRLYRQACEGARRMLLSILPVQLQQIDMKHIMNLPMPWQLKLIQHRRQLPEHLDSANPLLEQLPAGPVGQI